MYAKLVKLRYTWTAIAFAIIFTLVGIWYTQDTDIYGLDAKLEVEAISVTVIHAGDGKNEHRTVELAPEDAAYGEVLSRLEGMTFKRPFKNLLYDSSILKRELPPEDPILPEGVFQLRVELSGPPEQVLTLMWDKDHWEYRKSSYDADLPLNVPAQAETQDTLNEYFWEIAQ
jgi:hypothetical protein